MAGSTPHVVILGAGFGGLNAAKGLRRAPVRVTVVDRVNYHLFQPLLYEVATAALSPADIASPIRKVLARQKNATVLLGRATRIDPARRLVYLTDGVLEYDYLILATGATHSYLGHDDWSVHAPGLKTVEDAVEIRRRFLLAFEAAEREADPAARRAKLTFVIVGGGPTGVELAGTMSELARRAIPRDFRAIDTTTSRVILVEAENRVLPSFDPKLSAKAKEALEKLGVEVRLNSRVTHIDGDGVTIGEERIAAQNVIWAAGVQASPLGASLGVPTDRAGRVIVQPDLSIPGHPEVFVIGDLAKVTDPRTGKDVPGVAPAAIQMGRFVAKIIAEEAAFEARMARRPAFHYKDRGVLATIGRAKAVGVVAGIKLWGFIAWIIWALVHVMQLIEFRNRLIVMVEWAWSYLAFQRGARLITGPMDLDLRRPREQSQSAAAMPAAPLCEPPQTPVAAAGPRQDES